MSPLIPLSSNVDVNMHNGVLMFNIGAYPACVPVFEHSLRLDPLNCRTRYYLSLSYFRMRMYDEAAEVFNSLQCKDESENRLACQLLIRAFLLREGNPLEDVQMLTAAEAEEMLEIMKASPLIPEPFANLLWADKWDHNDHYPLDLSIILGPNMHLYCTVPYDQSPVDIGTGYDWIPVWCCPMNVFDRETAKHLFFQRALWHVKNEYCFPDPPMYSRTTFPDRHRQILLKRIYPDGPFSMDTHTWKVSDSFPFPR